MAGVPQIPLVRGCFLAAQAVQGVAATLSNINWLNWCTGMKLTDDIKYDTPKTLAYRLWLESQGIALTRVAAWEMTFLVDTWQWAWLLYSFDGSPTGAGPYVFTPGANLCKLLTIGKVNKNLTTYRRFIDGICTEVALAYDVSKVLLGTAKGLAVQAEPLGSPPTPSYLTPADLSPLRNSWGVHTVNGVAVGVETAKWQINEPATPFFTSPTTAPGSSDPGGVAPSAWEIAELNGRLDLVTQYSADAASQLYNYRHDAENATNSLSMIDPVTAGSHGLVITVPFMKALTGVEDDSKAVSRQTTQQALLYRASNAYAMTVSVHGGVALTPS